MLVTPIIRGNWAAIGEPDPFGSPINRWVSSSGLFSNTGGTTPQTTNAGAVNSWKSTHGNLDLIPSGTTQSDPTLSTVGVNGKPSINFGGLQDFWFVTFTYNAPQTIFFVGTLDSDATFYYDGTGSSPARMAMRRATNIDILGQVAGSSPTGLVVPTGTQVIICAIFNGASARVRLNAGIAVTGDTGTTNAGGFVLGSRSDGANKSIFKVQEIVLYNTAFSVGDETSERNILNGYYGAF